METYAGRLYFDQPQLDDPNAPSNQGDPFKEFGSYEPGFDAPGRPARELVSERSKANLISSLTTKPGMHKPAIDIDMPIEARPSKTPGHFHLFIDKEMDWDTYYNLLWAMERAGIVEPGYVRAAHEAQATFVRKDPQSRPDRHPKVDTLKTCSRGYLGCTTDHDKPVPTPTRYSFR